MGKKAKLYMTTRPEALVILLFLFSFALEAGRACSRPRQWKHGRELARLLLRLRKAIPGYKKYSKKRWSCRNPVSYATLRLHRSIAPTLSPDVLREYLRRGTLIALSILTK